MTRIRSREAALPQRASVTDEDFDALEKKVGHAFDSTLRSGIEAACNSYREEKALQDAAARFSDVIAEFNSLRDDLLSAAKRLSKLLSAGEPGPREAVDLLESRLSLRHSADPEIEPLSDFSLRLRAMAEHVKETQGALQKNYGRRSGRDPDEALDHLVVRLVPIAKAAGISPTAHYSDAKGKRSGRFVALLREVLCLATGKPIYGSGPAERAARVLKSLK